MTREYPGVQFEDTALRLTSVSFPGSTGTVPIEGIVPAQWRSAVVEDRPDGSRGVERIPYELCVLAALREAIRRREVWVVGAVRWRDPDANSVIDAIISGSRIAPRQAPLTQRRGLAQAAAFARLDRDGRPPEGALSLDCADEGVPYGMLVHGDRLRLFRMVTDPGAAASTTSYLELDVAALRELERPLIGLFAPVSLRPGGHFQRLIEDARRFGAQLRDWLDVELRERVLPHLASGIGAWARGAGRDLAKPSVPSEIEQACLAWVFRALFVLYAESAGYLPLDHAGYAANAATSLAAEASSGYDDLDPASTSLWDRSAVLVRALRTGDRGMHVPAYNGDLFAADALPGARTLEDCTVPNAAFGRVLAALGRDPETGVGVDYSSLEIGHLGHLYEGLLSLKVSLADVQLGLYRTGAGNEERFEPARRPQDVVRRGRTYLKTSLSFAPACLRLLLLWSFLPSARSCLLPVAPPTFSLA
jgi:hypothetical protein